MLLELAHPKTCICGVSSHFEHFFLVKIEFMFSMAFPIWKPYLFLKNTQNCFLPRRTAQNHLKVPVERFLGMPITVMVIRSLTNSLWDKVCILLNNGNFAKKKNALQFGLLPHTPSYPFLLYSPDEIWSLSKKVFGLPIRNVNRWRNMEHFAAIFFRYSLLSNVAKYSESSSMMSSFQDNAYI